jgi:hypothetical protein
MMEMRVVIRQILERTDLKPASAKREKGVRKGIVFGPKHGARVIWA